jgi:hypothetical protein
MGWAEERVNCRARGLVCTSYNGYYVNFLTLTEKKARSPLNQDRAHGKKLTLSLMETL